MRSVKFMMAAAAASLMSTAAFAADMPIAPPPAYAPPPVEDFGGWYLRGDIGFSNQQVKSLENPNYAGLSSLNQSTSFDTAGIFGAGVGYQFNNWFRMDVTGQYRGKSNFKGTDLITFPVGGVVGSGVDNYSASKSEWLVMANAYVDLGTWWCVTPFIGAGVGASRVSISGFRDNGLTDAAFFPGVGLQRGAFASSAYAADTSKWNFAWALHTGLAYQVSPNMTMELGYSYVNLGKGITGDIVGYDGSNGSFNPTTFKDITSHDLKLGVRWNLDAAPSYAPPPLIRKG
jgi:opacity protein-like surface antigen